MILRRAPAARKPTEADQLHQPTSATGPTNLVSSACEHHVRLADRGGGRPPESAIVGPPPERTAPRDWGEAGYHEIKHARGKSRIIDRAALSGLLALSEDRLAGLHEEWIETTLASGHHARAPKWSEAIAVGRRSFVEEVQRNLGGRARYREIAEEDGASVLREPDGTYGIISLSKWAA